MKVEIVNNSVYQKQHSVESIAEKRHNDIAQLSHTFMQANSNQGVNFKGNGDLSKRGWLLFRNISDYMKEKSEMTSAVIAFIGTAGIAPVAIMCSPGKGKKKGETQPTEEEKQHAKEKKFFQALRQPISAFLAFAFQMPTTLGIAKIFDYYAYKNPKKVFRDEIIGDLVPDKKYLKKQAMSVIKGKADAKTQAEWAEEYKIALDSDKITQELKVKEKQKYDEVGMDVSDEKLERKANNKNKKNKFIAEKMADAKHKKLMDAKINSLIGQQFEIKDMDLVTEDYQNLAKHRYKDEFKALEKNSKLNVLDNIVQSMGFSNKKIKNLEDAKKQLAKEKGLELLKQDNPGIMEDKAAKFKKFIETKSASAQKVYSNKVFWITLVTNLVMVAISCTALNWLHPKFADFVDGIKQARREEKQRKQTSQQTEPSVIEKKSEVANGIS